MENVPLTFGNKLVFYSSATYINSVYTTRGAQTEVTCSNEVLC